MKLFFASLLMLVVTTAFAPRPLEYVYIDENPKSALYHDDANCKELKKKGHGKIIKVTKDDAVAKYKRTPCPLCCKKDEKTN